MASNQLFDDIRQQSSMSFHRPLSITRFHSGRIAPDNTENSMRASLESQSQLPFDLHIDEEMLGSGEFRSLSSLTDNQAYVRSSTALSTNENVREPVVKISQYRTPESTPFQPLSSKTSKKKLNKYILLTPRTILSISVLTILSLIVVLIGLGIAISERISKLNYRCPLMSYCPRNSSYTVICNTTNEYCSCYDTNDLLIGCFKQRRYGDGCYRSQECANNYNLQCNTSLYQCQCLDHYYYNGSTCMPMITYNQTCLILNDRCDYLLNLSCLIGYICACDTTATFWNGQHCEYYRSLNDPCNPYKTPSGCSSTFTCDNSTATCQCPPSTYFDGEECLSYSSNLQPCYDASSCLPYSLLICSWGLCQCDERYYYWSESTSKCVYPKKATYNSTCDYYATCESDFGLRCINGQCLCEVNSYWTPGNYCDFQSQYGEQCSTAPCLGNTGLICSSNTSMCTCPQFYYWDNYVCQYQRAYTGFCVFDYWCRQDLGLQCRNFTCTCSLCTTCFWDGVRCRDCPTSWEIVVSNGTMQPRIYCYVKVDSYVNWNASVLACSTAATSFFGTRSHLVYINDLQELTDVSVFATNQYYDIFIGHTNAYNYSQWFLSNGTLSPPLHWCPGLATTYATLTCTRLLIGAVCVTNIACYGWTSRYICELD
ncbi:unnamed protein product [Rotaria magnacalcarata]|uniref:EGF-like domain-containing protein n=6 Tax=Rotaria magnacalcarata TaxID=392030 RepID=A0A814FD26_9BILA|nr:unnamed protein product [Rotaria magnacalcarata]CAF3884421.1 unnamed protein product [Rotaria magnacalcarata]